MRGPHGGGLCVGRGAVRRDEGRGRRAVRGVENGDMVPTERPAAR